MTSAPAFGLLLDVDGPVASPVDRAIVQPSIVPDLLFLLEAGIPVVFNTGRSEEFLRHEVVEPLQEVGIPSGSRLHGVCEKGAVWFDIWPTGPVEVQVDRKFALPDEYAKRIEALVAHRYGDTMFFDQTKHAMLSVEQNLETPSREYREAQSAFIEEAFLLFADLGIGGELGDRRHPDARGEVLFRIDPTIISTDIEAVVLGKDFGAKRALDMLAMNGEMPLHWRTVGDSRSDYKMADWLHERGMAVAHVDVRPEDGLLERPYPVLVPKAGVINDEAGAAYLHRVREIVEGTAVGDSEF